MAIRITEDGTVIYENEPDVNRELFPNIPEGSASQEQITQAVADWLDAHPEATTTVEDGSITRAKLDSGLNSYLDTVDTEIGELKEKLNQQVISTETLLTGIASADFFPYNERYNKGTGTIVSGGSYMTSGYVYLQTMPKINYTFTESSTTNIVTLFDENFSYVGYSVTTLDSQILMEDFPTAKWARFSVMQTNLSTFSIRIPLDDTNNAINELKDDTDIISAVVEAIFNQNFASLFTINARYPQGTGTITYGGSYYSTPQIPIEIIKNLQVTYDLPSPISVNIITLFNSNREYVGYTQTLTNLTTLLLDYPTAYYVVYSCFNSLMTTIRALTTLENTFYELAPKPLPLSANIFMRVGCIGDSYTAGYIKITAEGHTTNIYPQYSWPTQMETLTGRKWTNFGVGGSSTKSWIEGTGGLTKLSEVQAEGNKCQAYVIGLGINDIRNPDTRVSLGTASDIGTNADSYYAYYYKLVHEVYNVNNDAKIFCTTLPQPNLPNVSGYNQAVSDIVTYCKNEGISIFVCDLAGVYYTDYLYANSIYISDKIQGHYTAIGYNFMAQCLHQTLSDVINKNISDFQNVFEIDYDAV